MYELMMFRPIHLHLQEVIYLCVKYITYLKYNNLLLEKYVRMSVKKKVKTVDGFVV